MRSKDSRYISAVTTEGKQSKIRPEMTSKMIISKKATLASMTGSVRLKEQK
jgi:hypothetical protein